MTTLTKKEFDELATVYGGRCVSVFMPTHHSGQEVLNRTDQLVFKNLLKDIEADLINRGFSVRETVDFMEPAHQLQQNGSFWRKQSDGLAVFLANGFLRYYILPLPFEPGYRILHEFDLKPLLPVFIDNPEFYLLTLNFQDVRLYRGTKTGLSEIKPEGALPQRMEEVVGFDFEQKMLGYRAQKGGQPQVIIHGHGEGKDDRKDEIRAFFRAIDKVVAAYLHAENVPLVIASLDYLFPLYEKVNSYNHLFPEHISGNPEYEKPAALHRQALNLLASGFEKTKARKKEQFLQYYDTARSSTDIRQIIPAAKGGQVETLFLAKDYDVWGVYDSRDAAVRIQDAQNPSNTLLTNLAAVSVFQNGGSVYLEERDALPFPDSGINALYRYGG